MSWESNDRRGHFMGAIADIVDSSRGSTGTRFERREGLRSAFIVCLSQPAGRRNSLPVGVVAS